MNTERIDQALGYADKWTKRPVVDQSMNGHMQVLAAEVRRRRELDGLTEELIGFARIYAGYPSSKRPLLRGKLALYDAVMGGTGSANAGPDNGSNAETGDDDGNGDERERGEGGPVPEADRGADRTAREPCVRG